jgi:4-hydroxyproline epimerase
MFAVSIHTFFCIDGHTCGMPVRVVAGGAPALEGATMSERRQDFLRRHDWIRRSLMFEPRGHDAMSGSILYPPLGAEADAAVLFIETSGSLPMCGHGTIGTVTAGVEHGLIVPRAEDRVVLETPAGLVTAEIERAERYVESVRLRNVASYLHAAEVPVSCPGLGDLVVDIAYGGNFYAIVEPQPNYRDLADFSAGDLIRLSPLLRGAVNRAEKAVHPEDPTIVGVSHVLWTGRPRNRQAHARNAVFFGERGIDRSPCGTGTSARMAQRVAKGTLKVGEDFLHESIIGSLFHGRVEGETRVGERSAILPSVAGWARVTGFNTLFVDDRDPFREGFQLA